MQILIVFTVIFLAVIYAGWRIYGALKPDEEPCKGCELKKNCKKFGQSK